jgi:hypothetical protein
MAKTFVELWSGIGEKLAENIVTCSENGPLRIKTTQKKYLVWAKSLSARCLFN